MNDAALPNDPAARTSTGELKDASQTQTTTTEQTTPQTTESNTDDKKPSDPAAKPAGAPEAYAAFTAPEGTELDAGAVERATPIFKELGLDQAQAQRLVDFYNTEIKGKADAAIKTVETMRADWVKEAQADPEIAKAMQPITAADGSRTTLLQQEIGKAMQHLNDPKLVANFKAAMDLTGAGDHPAFIKAFYKFAALVNEGKHVSGAGPSEHGQTKPGTNSKPSLASAMFPNLPN